MAAVQGKKYRPWDPEAVANHSYTAAEPLPQDDLVFFLLDVIPHLDLSRFYASYEVEKRGAPPYDPGMMATLLFYSYSVGVFSSRKIALACERNLAFLALVGPQRPDFRTISDFRKEHLGVLPGTLASIPLPQRWPVATCPRSRRYGAGTRSRPRRATRP